MPGTLDQPSTHADVDRATYLAFARTWAASAAVSPVPAQEIQQRVVRYFRRLCRRIEPTVSLEVGAHQARFSRWVARHLPAARVVAFEANPHVHAKYADTLAATSVDYRHAAIGPVTGEVTLNLPTEVRGRSRSLTSRMASLAIHTQAGDHVQVSVPSLPLDDAVSLSDDDRVVAWVDVEGANKLVLGSGPAVLDRTHAIYLEVESETTWEEQWLDSDVALHLREHGLVPVARDVERPHQYNVVYVRSHLVDDDVTRRAAGILGRPPS